MSDAYNAFVANPAPPVSSESLSLQVWLIFTAFIGLPLWYLIDSAIMITLLQRAIKRFILRRNPNEWTVKRTAENKIVDFIHEYLLLLSSSFPGATSCSYSFYSRRNEERILYSLDGLRVCLLLILIYLFKKSYLSNKLGLQLGICSRLKKREIVC